MINIQKFYTIHFNHIQSTLVLLRPLWSTTFIVNFWPEERETIRKFWAKLYNFEFKNANKIDIKNQKYEL